MRIMKWKGCGTKKSWPILRYHAGIFLQELGKPVAFVVYG
jgi:hypothetical protein